MKIELAEDIEWVLDTLVTKGLHSERHDFQLSFADCAIVSNSQARAGEEWPDIYSFGRTCSLQIFLEEIGNC